MLTPQKLAQKLYDYFDTPDKWCQGQYYDFSNNRCCILGAIFSPKIIGASEEEYQAFKKYWYDRYGTAIATWQDLATFDEMKARLKEIANETRR